LGSAHPKKELNHGPAGDSPVSVLRLSISKSYERAGHLFGTLRGNYRPLYLGWQDVSVGPSGSKVVFEGKKRLEIEGFGAPRIFLVEVSKRKPGVTSCRKKLFGRKVRY
jgi:hypothetical protein